MKEAAKHMDAIIGRVEEKGCVLMLDFDGTLSPIVPHHRRAAISPKALFALRALVKRLPVAVISGRALADVQARVGIDGISYAGSHGLEVRMVRSRAAISVALSKKAAAGFAAAKDSLREISLQYPKARIEDKKLSYAVHYRSLTPKERHDFVRAARTALAPYERVDGVRVIDDLSTFDIMPRSKNTKGKCAREMHRALKTNRDAVAVYIGDGTTDEDAFRSLKNGITIRVGKSAKSAAKYYFKSRNKVDVFLARLLQNSR